MNVIDCSLHPLPASSEELLDYLPEPWRSRPLPPAWDRWIYRSPIGEFDQPGGRGAIPGSDPRAAAGELLSEEGISVAVLLPLGRGVLGDIRHETAIAAATNDWMAATWLSAGNDHGRFKSSIRICPRDPAAAVREIERWAGHPHVVQVAVPLEAHVPYGQQQYFPIWECAQRHRLPVALHAEKSRGAELPLTPVGYPSHYVEAHTLSPLRACAHLASFICEGVFDRLPGLQVVLADGAFDAVQTIMWRLDNDWRASRDEMPWTGRPPSRYLADHVRFVLHRCDGPPSPERWERLAAVLQVDRVLLYGSDYPYWDFVGPTTMMAELPPALHASVMADNAARLYRLPRPGQ